MGLNIPSI